MSQTFNERRAIDRIRLSAHHDFAERDRQQLIRHTKITPMLREMFEAEQREQESRMDGLVLAVCFGVALWFMVPVLVEWIAR